MRRRLVVFLSIVLVMCMIINISIPVFAIEANHFNATIIYKNKSEVILKDIFNNLTEEQKEIFIDEMLFQASEGDTRLLDTHLKEVDPSFQIEMNKMDIYSRAVTGTRALTLAQELQNLALPSAVYYGLTSFAAALSVPVGNVVDVAIGLGLTIIIIYNWNAISSKWSKIVDIFSRHIGKNVESAFTYLKLKAVGTKVVDPDSKLPNQGKVTDEEHADSPHVDAGKQGKHVPGHNNSDSSKSQWPKGKNGVKETQEAWEKGKTIKPDGTVREYDFKRAVGPNKETKVRVHKSTSDGLIHGYPVK